MSNRLKGAKLSGSVDIEVAAPRRPLGQAAGEASCGRVQRKLARHSAMGASAGGVTSGVHLILAEGDARDMAHAGVEAEVQRR